MATKKSKTTAYSDVDQIIDTQAFVESIKSGFSNINDPRVKDHQLYSLTSLLIMILAATIAGANAITHIHEYARLKIDLFTRLLGITQVPTYTTFWWLLVRLKPDELQQAFIHWIQVLPDEMKEKIIAIDGKRLNGASRQLVHLVSAWDTCRGLLLGQVKTEEKSNEITAIPELIKLIDVRGATVTIDAMGCQKKIIEVIRDGGGNYVIGLKANQGNLLDEAVNFFTQAREVAYEGADCQVATTVENGHGRIEEREIVVTSNLEWLETRAEWRDLTTLIEVTSRRTINGKTSEEKRYYICNIS